MPAKRPKIGPRRRLVRQLARSVAPRDRRSSRVLQRSSRIASAPSATFRLDQFARHQVELLRPHRGVAGDGEHAARAPPSGWPRRRSPGRRRPPRSPARAASVVAGASVAVSASTAVESGARRGRSCRERLLEDGAGRDAQPRDRSRAGAGHVAEIGGGDHALPAAGELARRAARGARSRARSSRRRAASAACDRVRWRAPSRSASSSASSARRCWPWEP